MLSDDCIYRYCTLFMIGLDIRLLLCLDGLCAIHDSCLGLLPLNWLRWTICKYVDILDLTVVMLISWAHIRSFTYYALVHLINYLWAYASLETKYNFIIAMILHVGHVVRIDLDMLRSIVHLWWYCYCDGMKFLRCNYNNIVIIMARGL